MSILGIVKHKNQSPINDFYILVELFIREEDKSYYWKSITEDYGVSPDYDKIVKKHPTAIFVGAKRVAGYEYGHFLYNFLKEDLK